VGAMLAAVVAPAFLYVLLGRDPSRLGRRTGRASRGGDARPLTRPRRWRFDCASNPRTPIGSLVAK